MLPIILIQNIKIILIFFKFNLKNSRTLKMVESLASYFLGCFADSMASMIPKNNRT